MRINLQFAKFSKSSNGTAIESFYLLEDCICYQSSGSLNNGGNTTDNGGINGNSNNGTSGTGSTSIGGHSGRNHSNDIIKSKTYLSDGFGNGKKRDIEFFYFK